RAGRGGHLDREGRAGERGAEGDAAPIPIDPRQLPGGPVAGDLRELHPDQVVEPRLEAGDNLPEDREADLLAREVEPWPVADQDRRLAAADHLGEAAALEVLGDEAVDRAALQAVPAAEPVAGAADDRDHAARVGAVQAARVFDPRGDAALVGVEVAEV